MERRKVVNKKVLVFGAGGRVGLALVRGLLARGISVVAVDYLSELELRARVARVTIDRGLLFDPSDAAAATTTTIGGVDVLDAVAITHILQREQPDAVVNYAIPFTWDATKQLSNYRQISAAGLGAFAPIQLLAPMSVASAMSSAGLDVPLLIGNLPDITVPVIAGLASTGGYQRPTCGAGNVGLIATATRHILALDNGVSSADVDLRLVAHHVHWVAPREPGYPEDAPFLLHASVAQQPLQISTEDARTLINRAIVECYEPGAGFSSTTGLLAAQVLATVLSDEFSESFSQRLHIPAVNGRPGGYPVRVKAGQLHLDLAPEWNESMTEQTMREAHWRDGIKEIDTDGGIHFQPESIEILRRELGFELPQYVSPNSLVEVGLAQLEQALSAIAS